MLVDIGQRHPPACLLSHVDDVLERLDPLLCLRCQLLAHLPAQPVVGRKGRRCQKTHASENPIGESLLKKRVQLRLAPDKGDKVPFWEPREKGVEHEQGHAVQCAEGRDPDRHPLSRVERTSKEKARGELGPQDRRCARLLGERHRLHPDGNYAEVHVELRKLLLQYVLVEAHQEALDIADVHLHTVRRRVSWVKARAGLPPSLLGLGREHDLL